MADSINYPDMLGAITGGVRAVIGHAQLAVGIRPRTARAGKPFDVILLAQNMLDVPIDVSVVLHLPAQDIQRKRDQFVSKNARIVVGMGAAETGMIVLPAAVLSTCTPSDKYTFSVEVSVKQIGGDARQIREANGSAPCDFSLLPDAEREVAESLSSVAFSANKKLARSILEAPLPVFPGGLANFVSLKPGYVRLWSPEIYADPRPLMHMQGDRMLLHVFPAVRRLHTYKPLMSATTDSFRRAGFDLFEPEAALITKLLVLLLEYAAPVESGHGYNVAGRYSVAPMLLKNPMEIPAPPTLPRWTLDMMAKLVRDPNASLQAATLVSESLYASLVYDAIVFAFAMIERETGEDLGTDAEQAHFAGIIMEALQHDGKLNFSQVYLPLVIGGLLINEQMPVSKDPPDVLLKNFTAVFQRRAATQPDETQPLITLISGIITRMEQRLGFR
ncbi:MAG: hypothetical protein KME04_05345 [Pleurocapsa minor GSE-CHR-MK-17-07R]|jgi:hypothetical protein|nr:hypothetical protein [Pleurocapsa minor GSE-CHR-MK 17-07R]